MNILVVCGSPHKNGTTNAMADALISAIDLNQHQVEKIQLCEKKVSPCLGCNYCRNHGGTCIQQDDMQSLYPSLLKADLVVFASPLYYFGFTAQIKAFIDRFYAVNTQLRAQTEKKAILLTAGGGEEEWIMDGIEANYDTMLRYLHWKSVGKVCAYSCSVKEDWEQTSYLEEAKALGAALS